MCRVKNMLAMYLKSHKAVLTPTTPVSSIAISPVKMSIGRKSLTNLRSGMIFLQGKSVFYIFLPSTPPYWQIILRFCWQWTPKWQKAKVGHVRHISAFWSFSGFIIALRNIPEKFRKRNYISYMPTLERLKAVGGSSVCHPPPTNCFSGCKMVHSVAFRI